MYPFNIYPFLSQQSLLATTPAVHVGAAPAALDTAADYLTDALITIDILSDTLDGQPPPDQTDCELELFL